MEGTNLLGFLAALGAFLAVGRQQAGDIDVSPWRMRWEKDVVWRPVLEFNGTTTKKYIVDRIYSELSKRNIDVKDVNGTQLDDIKLTLDEFNSEAHSFVISSTLSARANADFLAALAGEVVARKGADSVEDTALRTSAGNLHFLKIMRTLVSNVTKQDIESALFDRWQYRSTKQMALRLDPVENRQWALRGTDPSRTDVMSVPGANRLAVEALDLFTTFPRSHLLYTTGFPPRPRGIKKVSMRWPLWEDPITVDTLRPLLLLKEIYSLDSKDRNRHKKAKRALRYLRVHVVESSRSHSGRYRNFQPGKLLA